jgi:CheY-like chemotaxis protein
MKILIAEDEPLIRRSLDRAFSRAGHQVQTAQDGEAALELWRQNPPDVAILDVLMPKMTGPELVMAVRQAGSVGTTRVVLMTAYASSEEWGEFKPDLFLTKPFEDILVVVQRIEELHRVRQ